MEAPSSQSANATNKDGGRPKNFQPNAQKGKILTPDLKASSADNKAPTESGLPIPKKGDKSKEKSGVKSAKPPATNPPPKTTWKAVIRKLPPSREFAREQFEDFISKVCQALRISPSAFTVDHFIDGKISRKRGPINGAGFIAFQDEVAFQSFLANCAAQASLVYEDMLGQIEVSAAPYSRSFRQKVDKNENTSETDSEFLAFQERLKKGDAAPVPRLAATETDTLSVADKMKSNPLLSYLRDRAIEKAQRRRGNNPTSGDERSNRKKEKKDKKEKEKLSRKEKKKLKIMKKASSSVLSDTAGGNVKSGTGSGSSAGGKGSKDYSKRPSATGNHVPSDSPAGASILQKGTVQKQHDQQKGGAQGGSNKQPPQQQQTRKENANSKPSAAPATASNNTNPSSGPSQHKQTEYRNNSGGGGHGNSGGGRNRDGGRGGGGRGDHIESNKPPQGQQPVKVLRKESNSNAGSGSSNS